MLCAAALVPERTAPMPLQALSAFARCEYNRATMDERATTVVVQGYLDSLAGMENDASAEPIIRALLARSVSRLRSLCQALLYRHYPRLTKGPTNLETDELLSGVVERLIKAMREIRPQTVRQFFSLASQHMRWELNDVARRLDGRTPAVELEGWRVAANDEASDSGGNPGFHRILEAIEKLDEDEREVFTLVRIQGITNREAATIIGVNVRTVQRRLNRSIVHLSEMLRDIHPGFQGVDKTAMGLRPG
jgi:RNA polymerase sigma-70 factor (ECF subfamily)